MEPPMFKAIRSLAFAFIVDRTVRAIQRSRQRALNPSREVRSRRLR